MKDTTCNGWTNWETWITSLWLDNDQCLYAALRDMAESAFDRALSPDAGLSAAADVLKDWYDNEVDILLNKGISGKPVDAGLFMDILNAHSREVAWYEIAQHMLEEYVESLRD